MQKTNKWPIEDCGCILCWWKVPRKDCWMEMIRQKLKQQKGKDPRWKIELSSEKLYCPHFYQAASADNRRKFEEMFDVASI